MFKYIRTEVVKRFKDILVRSPDGYSKYIIIIQYYITSTYDKNITSLSINCKIEYKRSICRCSRVGINVYYILYKYTI